MAATRGIARTTSMMSAASGLAAYAAYSASVALVSARLGVPAEHINTREGRYYYTAPPDVVRARRSALYLSVVAFDRSLRSIARAASLTPEGVRKALVAIEDLRDDPRFDRILSDMEQELAA